MSDHRLIGPILPPSFRNNQLNNVSCSDDDSQDVINSSERSDDNLIGPVLPTKDKPSESEVKRYGPSIPDCFKNQDIEENSNDDDYEEYGPALPLSLQNNKSISKDENVDYTQNDGNDSDSDDNMIGPMPDGLVDKNHMYDASIRLQKSKKDITKREKWMLEPPKALKSTLQTKSVTKFSQKSSKIKDKPLSEEERIELEASKEKEQIMEDFLDKYSKDKKRDVSLLDEHRSEITNKKPKIEKQERREFDREKDLNVPRMDSKAKKSFIKTASSTFSSRFSSGKFEKFL